MRHIARKAFTPGTWLLLVAVLVQFLLAGMGIFGDASFFFWHASVNAAVVFFLPLLLVLVGLLGRVPRRLLWLTAAISGLVVLQSILIAPYRMALGEPLRAIASLHVVNAILIFWIAIKVMEGASELDSKVGQV